MEILVTEEFAAWLADLTSVNRHEAISVNTAVKLLALKGFTLDFPWSSSLNGTEYPLRELRPRRGNSPHRVIYAFDPERNAVLLIGGHKERGIYYTGLRRAEKLWTAHLAHLAALAQTKRLSRDRKE